SALQTRPEGAWFVANRHLLLGRPWATRAVFGGFAGMFHFDVFPADLIGNLLPVCPVLFAHMNLLAQPCFLMDDRLLAAERNVNLLLLEGLAGRCGASGLPGRDAVHHDFLAPQLDRGVC